MEPHVFLPGAERCPLIAGARASPAASITRVISRSRFFLLSMPTSPRAKVPELTCRLQPCRVQGSIIHAAASFFLGSGGAAV